MGKVKYVMNKVGENNERHRVAVLLNTLNLHTPLTSGVGLKTQILKLCRCKYISLLR